MRRRLLGPALILSAALSAAAPAAARVLTGLDVLEAGGFSQLRGKRVGLITNQTGVDGSGRSNVSLLSSAPGVTLAALFSPEHGFKGSAEAARISSGRLRLSDGRAIPLYSLYGSTLAPTARMLAGLDVLVFDIQDVGARFYTYATTMGLALHAAERAGLPFYVLDRPNPIGGRLVEGPTLDAGLRGFIAYDDVPVRHGLTMGELAGLQGRGLRPGILRVVAMQGWRRGMWFDQTGLPWVRPSPNMPDLASATLYPGIGCLEFSNLSVGRGTPRPFLWIGAPWLKTRALLGALGRRPLPGVRFRALDFTPSKPPYAGRHCRGLAIDILDRRLLRPLDVFAALACALRDTQPRFKLRWPRTRYLVGSERFFALYRSGAGPRAIMAYFHARARSFQRRRRALL
ncbi:MAG: DUF1343 domain-containing protein, partial [Elusimicrobia bacterium]|nr:DUF1343 domain-containing protein [Elusimicrobiota bacterium]